MPLTQSESLLLPTLDYPRLVHYQARPAPVSFFFIQVISVSENQSKAWSDAFRAIPEAGFLNSIVVIERKRIRRAACPC